MRRGSRLRSRATIVACPGALEPELVDRIVKARGRGRAVTLGPHAPVADASFRAVSAPHAFVTEPGDAVPALLPFDEAAIVRAVTEAQIRLQLPTLTALPADIRVTLHADERGVPRVLFVINATPHPIDARVSAAGALEAEDVLDGARFHATTGLFELTVAPRSVRMLELRA